MTLPRARGKEKKETQKAQTIAPFPFRYINLEHSALS
jgi:hypothetical protein